jgi:hypothetical protein
MSEPLIFVITHVGYESERLPIAFVLLGLIKTPDDDPEHQQRPIDDHLTTVRCQKEARTSLSMENNRPKDQNPQASDDP